MIIDNFTLNISALHIEVKLVVLGVCFSFL
jgi:hypothetical protein